MIGLIKNNELVPDEFVHVPDGEPIPEEGAVIVHLEPWRAERARLLGRGTPIGVRLKSHEAPELVAEDLSRLAVIALEFPVFRDGRAYSYARMLRERYGYTGEVRAVGDVLMEQIHFMLRTGFDAFEIDAEDPLSDFRAAMGDFSVWYQPTGDGRPTAMQLRHRGRERQS